MNISVDNSTFNIDFIHNHFVNQIFMKCLLHITRLVSLLLFIIRIWTYECSYERAETFNEALAPMIVDSVKEIF